MDEARRDHARVMVALARGMAAAVTAHDSYVIAEAMLHADRLWEAVHRENNRMAAEGGGAALTLRVDPTIPPLFPDLDEAS